MIFRSLKPEHATATMEILHGAVCYLKAQGIDQWQKGYPDQTIVDQDIANHVAYGLFDDEQLIGVITLIRGIESNYANTPIDWLTDGSDYLTIHRIAAKHDGIHTHIGRKLFEHAIDFARKAQVQSIRCDTHGENVIMRHLMETNGFVYCGDIVLKDSGEPRVAYECVLY